MIDSDYQEAPSPTISEFPWPPPENGSVLEAAATTWKESVFHPTSFFKRMPREFDFGWVLGYYLVIGVIGAGLGLFWEMVLGPSPFSSMMAATGDAPNPAVDFLMSPLWLLLGLFVAAGVIHLFLMMFGAAKHGYGATARVFCFAAGPVLFEVVPYVGSMVAGVWGIVITIIGLREAHETTTGRAVAAILIPTFFLVLLFVLLVLAGMVMGVAHLGS